MWEEQVDETLSRGRRLMIGKARAFIGLYDNIVRLRRIRDQKVKAYDRDIDGPCSAYRRIDQSGMKLVRYVMHGAACVEIGGFAHDQRFPFRQNAVHVVSGAGNGTLGLIIHRNATLSAGCCLAATALFFDELFNGVVTRARHFGRTPDRRCHDLEVDDNDTQILPRHILFQQHGFAMGAGCSDSRFYLLRRPQINCDTAALLAAQRLYDEALVLLEKFRISLRRIGPALRREIEPFRRENAVRDGLVVTAAHRHRGSEFRERFPARDRAPSVGQAEEAALCIQYFNCNTAAARLVNNDSRVGIERFLGWFADIKFLIDRTAGLQAEALDRVKAELFVKRNGLFIIVENGKIHEGASPLLHAARQIENKGNADSGVGRLTVNGEAPEAGAFLRITENAFVIQSRDGTDNVPAASVACDKMKVAVVVPVREEEVIANLD